MGVIRHDALSTYIFMGHEAGSTAYVVKLLFLTTQSYTPKHAKTSIYSEVNPGLLENIYWSTCIYH